MTIVEALLFRYRALPVVLLCLACVTGCTQAPAPAQVGALLTPSSVPSRSAPATLESVATTAVALAPTPALEIALPTVESGMPEPEAATPDPLPGQIQMPSLTVAPGTTEAMPLATQVSRPTEAFGRTPTVESDARRRDPRVRAPATATPTPGPTPDGTERALRVPILMFHYVSQPPPGADAIRTSNSVAPDLFESYLRYLGDAGFHTVALDDLLFALVQGRTLPPKPVILTFDDGYEDNFSNAFPILQQYQMTGTFFLITDFVNQNRPEYMTWDQIKIMSDAGQRFGSHTRDHPDLRGKPVDYLVWEALGGLEAIQEHLGYHPRWVAYPSGKYDDQAIAVFKSANYWGGVTTDPGSTHSSDRLFALKRVRIFGYYTVEDLAKLLTGGG